jgi:hypothetical protein
VSLDGTAISETILRDSVMPDGRIAVGVGPGRHRLRARYDGPPGGAWRLLAMIMVVAACLVGLFWHRRAARTAIGAA